MVKQEDLFEPFRTAEEGSAIFCHEDFLDKIAENRNNQIGKRGSLLLERLIVDERRQHYKSTQGINKGWRRSRMGGHSGSHFYAWWAPRGAPPVRGVDGFDNAPEGAVFVRDIRHHDDHSELLPQSLDTHYAPVSVRDLRSEDYVPSPLTTAQARFTAGRQRVRIVKGYPGSGKTTALWHAADLNSSQSTLYVTYSRDLAALARTHFQRFASSHKEFHVLTFANLIRTLTGRDEPLEAEREARLRFIKQVSSLSPRILGPWLDDKKSLYDEVHAHLIGAALPVAVARFEACAHPRMPDRSYREKRRSVIGGAAADALLGVVNTLESRQPEQFCKQYFPELLLAWNAVQDLRSGKATVAAKFLDFDCIAVDEAQDLTPIEAMVLIKLAARIQRQPKRALTMLIAGDEAQTVRPTDFEWGWFHDLLHHSIGSPTDFKLNANLRSPRRIARLINAVWNLYITVAKQDRPSGGVDTEIEEDVSDQLVYCAAARGPELEQLLRTFGDREGLAIINLEEDIPGYIPEGVKHKMLSVFEAKGLDFQSVCILNPGKQLDRIMNVAERIGRDHAIEPLSRRLAIDQLRVAISRPSERIYFLDVEPTRQAGFRSMDFLSAADLDTDISPVIPAVVLKTLEEELLEPEERVRLCESDARQFLQVKPEMAWSRAKQAVSLLGKPGSPYAVSDQTVRQSAHLTLSEISFCLAFRNVRLPAELGNPNLYREAALGASLAGTLGLSRIIQRIESVQKLEPQFRRYALIDLLESLAQYQSEIASWLLVEISEKAKVWLKELEQSADDRAYAHRILSLLPDAYKLFDVLDGAERIATLRRDAVQSLMKAELYREALQILEQNPEEHPKLVAQCHEGMKNYAAAAEIFRRIGSSKDALRNYRSAPDFEKALELVEQASDRSAEETLRWIMEVRQVLDKRPAGFSKTATAAEKKFVADLLETNMQAPRTKRVARPKTAPRTAAKPRKPRPKVG